ncbi:MAG: thioredoxin domain-containing protein [Candidatus Sericytochromatia bacterium]|uniref:Thioredoxin domain-containing protein n=1 Tax=Candidatus Tanganyikabacteria bacterium TaxID=2961651 RepID=A0A937X5R0_9BACT|nr:thioredoxin domain-containing protein [Candidatus Tanganyikabacteria bacterium]
MANRLAREKSPYLRQHADNPVDWYPWGEEAFARARREDKPILLSVGYSACHWCHVMEHESFENDAIAGLMNEKFVNIKVDREERPDIDQIYMAAVQAMAGQGGWPMTVFMTPEGRPYFGGTYFPPADRYGRPGFPRVLLGAAAAYADRREDVERNADVILGHVQHALAQQVPGKMGPDILEQATILLGDHFEPRRGGFGRAPKFPPAMTLEFLLRVYHRSDDLHVKRMLTKTLDEMAAGGLYDQLGGGFHRYSTDDEWLVPHFEKMLYDNALLARVYALAAERLAEPRYARVARETLDWVLRDMTCPQGGFYSTLDADSEGEEGKFYVWEYPEVLTGLGSSQAEPFCAFYGVTMAGNWEGKTILHFHPGAAIPAEVEPGRAKLLELRNKRIPPGLDDKVVASWNGLMLEALADAARLLGDAQYRDAARRNADFLLTRMVKDGVLLRVWKDGDAGIPAFLEDYADVASGLLALYQATFEERWFVAARELADKAIALFWDEAGGLFFDSGSHNEKLVLRPRDPYDNAVPAGNSVISDVLLRLHALTGDGRYADIAGRVLEMFAGFMARVPTGFGRLLCVADFALADVREVAIVGAAPERGALVAAAITGYYPYRIVAIGDGADGTKVPLLAGRTTRDGLAAAYVCRRFACDAPVTTAEALAGKLQQT